MTPAQQAAYWKAYARQNAKYERYGAKLFHRALIESVQRAIQAGTLNYPDFIPLRNAYEQFYQHVGIAHKEWEDKRWAQYKADRSALQTKEDDRLAPKPAQGRGALNRVSEALVSFTLSFRNQAWLRRLRDLITGLDVASRITNVTETTRKKIQSILAQASQEEVRTGRIAKRILKEFQGKMGRKRAEMIARTETTYVANEAAKQSAEETGLDLVKIWVATLDNRTRDSHRALHGKDPIDSNKKFMVGGVAMDKPGDPAGGAKEVVNCRCIVAYLPKNDAEI